MAKVRIMNDDALSNDSSDDFSDELDYDDLPDSDINEDVDNIVSKPKVKKVACIMNKILSRNRPNGKAILSKAKVQKEKETLETEIKQTSEGTEGKPDRKKLKRKWIEMSRKKPSFEDIDNERKLRNLATQGVIQLFNTIEKHKTGLKHDLRRANTVNETEQIMAKKGKDSFMELLEKEGSKLKSETPNEKVKDEKGSSKSNWNVLAQNYYKEPSLQAWDEETSSSDSDHG